MSMISIKLDNSSTATSHSSVIILQTKKVERFKQSCMTTQLVFVFCHYHKLEECCSVLTYQKNIIYRSVWNDIIIKYNSYLKPTVYINSYQTSFGLLYSSWSINVFTSRIKSFSDAMAELEEKPSPLNLVAYNITDHDAEEVL